MDAAVGPLLEFDPATSVLVRVTALSGFGLRDGSDGAVVSDGTVHGRILGGLCDEAILAAVATNEGRHAFTARVSDEAADDAGMVCGGTAHLLATPMADLPGAITTWLGQAQPLALVCPADGSGNDLIVTRKETDGGLGDASSDEAAIDAAREQLAAGANATTVATIAGVDLAISTIVPSTEAVIVGSGPMADAIAAQGELMGWRCTISESVEDGLVFLDSAGPADALIVLSHDRAVDIPLLDAALRSPIGYIGGMGSRGTQTARANRLAELGHESIERIHGPIGLDLASRNPSETAVAIAAEFLANRSGRVPGRLTDSAGPING